MYTSKEFLCYCLSDEQLFEIMRINGMPNLEELRKNKIALLATLHVEIKSFFEKLQRNGAVIINVYHEDIVNMVCGVTPNSNDEEWLLHQELGESLLIEGERNWVWNRHNLEKMSTDELFNTYKIITNRYWKQKDE